MLSDFYPLSDDPSTGPRYAGVMGFLDSVKAWLKEESAEAADLGRSTSGKMSRELDRREAVQNASPSERMSQLQEDIANNDSSFEALQDKIEGKAALADAKADLADAESVDTQSVDDQHVDTQPADAQPVDADPERSNSNDSNAGGLDPEDPDIEDAVIVEDD